MSDSAGHPILKLSAIDAMRYDDVKSDVLRRAESLAERMERLRDDGVLDIATTDSGRVIWEHSRTAIYNAPQDRPDGDEHSRLYDECTYWEARSDFELTAAFDRTSVPDGAKRVEFPEILLLVYEDDVVRWNLEGVFPSVYADTGMPITPEDYLTTVEEGGNWRPSEADLVHVSHRSKRDELRSNLANDPEVVGDEWSYYDTRVTVPSADGMVDVVFEHRDRAEYLVVVVAPDPTDQEAFDRAFGRLVRLKSGFEDDVRAGAEDVRLAVAAPAFPEHYAWVEDEYGIELLTVGAD